MEVDCRPTQGFRRGQKVNERTMLLRQVHPMFLQNGRVTSQAFRPTPKDRDQLSVYDGDQIAPKAAYLHYTSDQKLESAGVMGITVGECDSLELQVKPDPAPFPEHVVIDFYGYSGNQKTKLGKKLAAKAKDRGWLYQP